MTNEQFENLTKMVQSDNFDDILLAVEIMKEQFWGDINDKNFIVPKRYRRILDTIQERCTIRYDLRKNYGPTRYDKLLKIVCAPDFENYRATFNFLVQTKNIKWD